MHSIHTYKLPRLKWQLWIYLCTFICHISSRRWAQLNWCGTIAWCRVVVKCSPGAVCICHPQISNFLLADPTVYVQPLQLVSCVCPLHPPVALTTFKTPDSSLQSWVGVDTTLPPGKGKLCPLVRSLWSASCLEPQSLQHASRLALLLAL